MLMVIIIVPKSTSLWNIQTQQEKQMKKTSYSLCVFNIYFIFRDISKYIISTCYDWPKNIYNFLQENDNITHNYFDVIFEIVLANDVYSLEKNILLNIDFKTYGKGENWFEKVTRNLNYDVWIDKCYYYIIIADNVYMKISTVS